MEGKATAGSARFATKNSKLIYVFTFMFLFIFGAGKLQAQNNVNMLPDSGNVGIGTSTPVEKFEVNGNAKIHGKVKMTDSLNVEGSIEVMQSLSVADSMWVGSKLSVEDDLTVGVDLVVGSDIDVSKNLFVADSLSVGTALKVPVIIDVSSITATETKTNAISNDNGVITFGDPTNVHCDNLRLNFCNRTISGFMTFADGSEKVVGLSVGSTSIANGMHAFSAGQLCNAAGDVSIAMGYGVRSFGAKSMTIGTSSSMFTNLKENSLMVGFNLAPGSNPSLFVGPSTAYFAGNVGIGTDEPKDKFQIGEGMESVSFGSALNDDAGWMSAYMSFNARRVRAGNGYEASVWEIAGDGQNANGACIFAAGGDGSLTMISIATSDGQSYSMDDATVKSRKLVKIFPDVYDSNNEISLRGTMQVYGKIWCEEIEINLDPSSWWDEVFEPGYKLRTFEELQAYIDENGHLPDVPSEEEVGENGLDLGESYGILLRKIEELTLYVLELKQENEELRQMIENNGQ